MEGVLHASTDALDDELSDVEGRIEELKSHVLVEEGANPRVEQRIESMERELKQVFEFKENLPAEAHEQLCHIESELDELSQRTGIM